MGKGRKWFEGGIEPKLEDMLSDPLIEVVMRSDGLTSDDVLSVVEEFRSRLRATAPGERKKMPA